MIEVMSCFTTLSFIAYASSYSAWFWIRTMYRAVSDSTRSIERSVSGWDSLVSKRLTTNFKFVFPLFSFVLLK